MGIKTPIEPCKMKDFPGAAKRPANCFLENRLLKKQRINQMNNWKKDLEIFLNKFGEDLVKQIQEEGL
jgi:dTDP-4-dehydrorhamnose reductase